MVRPGAPREEPTDRMYREHDHEWIAEPEAVHGIYNHRIEDGRAIFYVECRWQPEKIHSSEFRTVAEPMGPPCGEQRSVELTPDEELDPTVAHRLREAWVDGDLEVIDADPPESPDDDAHLTVATDGVRVLFETDQ